MKRITLLACLLFSLNAWAGDNDAEYDAEISRLNAQVAAGQITELAAARAQLSAAERLYPQDGNLLSLRNYRVLIASRLERGEIQRDEFDYLWNERRIAYRTARQQIQQQQAQHQAQGQQQQNMATGQLLQNIGNTLNRTYAQPQGTNCVTTGIGASLSTRCN